MGKWHDLIRESFFLIKKSKGIWGMGTQKHLVVKNKGSINNILLTVRPMSRWDSGPRDVVNPM